jgi:ornithine cyclodeaminase/alanine dehydrogenase-like protein (mu-crystallin family)
MKTVEFRYLSQKDVIDVGLTMKEAISIVEEVFTEHGLQAFENPPKPGIHTLKGAFIHAMPGFLPRKKAAGMKWVSGYSDNFQYNLPSIMGLITLNNPDTGQPIAVMDGGYVTALRTAAASGVSAKYLAAKDASVLGIVGAGVQGRYHLMSIREVFSGIEEIKITDTSESAMAEFISFAKEHGALNITSCTSAREVIQDADVVITATGHLEDRVYKENWVKKGALVLPVHTRGWEASMIGNANKFIVDDWQQFNSFMGGTEGYYAPLPELYAEMGEIVVGQKPGRENPTERIVNLNFGMAIHDVYMARIILERAEAKGVGMMLPLVE